MIKLEKGNTIGILALAGDCDKETTDNAVLNLQNAGYRVKLSSNIYKKERYLAGSDDDRVTALHDFFKDPEIDLIMAARGGYGTLKILQKIDCRLIKNNPKPIIGYSDITALLLTVYKKTGLITYHGPMGVSFSDEKFNKFTLDNMIKALNNETLELEGDKIFNKGSAKGIIWGGNLTTAASMCGLDFIPNEDFIFFAEDINEPAYKIDRMFTQLFNINKFKNNCKGIVLGDFLGVDNREWLDEFFSTLPCPAAGGFKITHDREMVTIPVGKQAVLEGKHLVIG